MLHVSQLMIEMNNGNQVHVCAVKGNYVLSATCLMVSNAIGL